jgi:phytoene synthase
MNTRIAPADLEACRAAIRTGSLSFHAASRLLPTAVRDPALALYAFCRLADDAVDEGDDKTAAVLRLRDRLDRVYAGCPVDAAADRAFAAVVEGFEMPRALPDALLEGMAWDAVGRRYDDLSGVLAYSARVAAAVGAMMCVLMRVREADALARACDLGLAMQLTNIARDVGEDARAGRLYLPQDWLRAEGVDPAAGAGVVAEVITTGAQTILISPGTLGFNNESSPVTEIYAAVTNKSGSTATITVTLTILKIEV